LENTKYHHGDLKNALIEAGLEIISQEGIDELSIRSVAKKIGVSHAAPYRHFKNKEEIIMAIALTGFRMRKKEVDKALARGGDDPRAQLVHLAKANIAFAVAHPDYFRVMFRDYIKNKTDYPDLFQAFDESFRQLVKIIRACREQGGSQEEITLSPEEKQFSSPHSAPGEMVFPEESEEVDDEITALAISALIQGYASLIIDNQKDPIVGSPVQIDLITGKLLDLI
jgi:AcrR family transcriptional regulator